NDNVRRRLAVIGLTFSLILLGLPGSPVVAVPPLTFGADISLAQDPAEHSVRNFVTITVVNNRLETLFGVSIHYQYDFIDSIGTPAGCRTPGPFPEGPSGDCAIGTLAPGRSRSFTFNVIPDGPHFNRVDVSGFGFGCGGFCFRNFSTGRGFAVVPPVD